MKALISIAAVSVALVVCTATAGAATAEGVDRLVKRSAVETSGQSAAVTQPLIGRWGAIGRYGVLQPLAAGFRW